MSKSQSVLSSLSLVGRVWGEVRRLPAFDKKRHTVPDGVNAATLAFLGKLCSDEVSSDAEALFQSVRQFLGYKRKEISLITDLGMAQMRAKGFVLEIRCELDDEDSSRYFIETELKEVSSKDLLEDAAFTSAIGSRFDRLRLELRGQVSVEAVVDAVEADESGELSVDYPSDCSSCDVRIEGVNADVFIDGAILEVRYGSMASAASLMVAFEGVGCRFRKSETLMDLLK